MDFLSRATTLGRSVTTLTHLGMALIASNNDDRARSILPEARTLETRPDGLEDRMLQCMKTSTHLLERSRRRKK